MSDADLRRRFVEEARTAAVARPPQSAAAAGRPGADAPEPAAAGTPGGGRAPGGPAATPGVAAARETGTAGLQPLEVGRALARELFSRVPNAGPLVAAAANGFAAVLQGAVGQAVPPVGSVGALLSPLLAPGAPAPPAPKGGDGDDPRAARIGALLAPLVGGALLATPPPGPTPAPPGAAQSAETLDSDLDELAQKEPFKTVRRVLEESGLLDLARASLGGGTLAAVTYTPDRVSAALRKLAEMFVKWYGPLVKPILYEVELSLKDAVARTALATAISAAAEALPFSIKSDRKIGREVHETLQESYVRLYSVSNDIVVERFNPDIGDKGQMDLFVVGPTTQHIPMSLQAVARDRQRDPEVFFLPLRLAMTGFKVPKETWLRADLVDAGIPGVLGGILSMLEGRPASIWEIKPVSALVTGVWQETLYRVSFNVIRRVMIAVAGVGSSPGGPVVGERFLRSGGFWHVSANPRQYAEGNYQVLLLDNIHVTSERGERAVAIPFQVGALPGLIGYYVLRGPNLPKLQYVIEAVLIPALLAALKKMADEIGKGLDEAVQTARRIYEELNEIAEAVNKAMLILLLVTAILAAAILLGILLVKGAAIAAAALGAAAMGALGAAATVGLIVLIVSAVSGDGPGQSPSAPSASAGELTDLKIGPVLVCGLPQEKVPQFLAEVQRQVYNIAGAAADVLQRRPPAVA